MEVKKLFQRRISVTRSVGSGCEQNSRGQRIKPNEKIRVQDNKSPGCEIREITLFKRHCVD